MIATQDLEQGSQEWLMARVGKITASRIADLTARTKTGWSSYRETYLMELVCERLTGLPTKTFVTEAMKWGIEKEAEARSFYEEFCDTEVVQCGLVMHPDMDYAGASPDGLIGADGLLEIKCLTPANHVGILTADKPPEKYIKQCMWQIACTHADYCDLMFYDPRMPDDSVVKIFTIPRSDSYIMELESQVEAFNDLVNERIGQCSVPPNSIRTFLEF